MTAIRRPPNQAYAPADYSPGEPRLGYDDPVRKDLYRLGQVGPKTEDRWFMQHGRYLAGLGATETQPSWDARYQDVNLRELEDEDDVFGSGIFDTYGSEPTVHINMGVFADHPSLPGYIDREVQYEVNRNISDITSGADVVAVPGGGMTFMERQRFPVPFDRSGPTPCPPELRPPPPTPVQQVFATLTPQTFPMDRGGGPKLLPPAVPGRDREPAPVTAGELLPPTAATLRESKIPIGPMGAIPLSSRRGQWPGQVSTVGMQNIVNTGVMPSPLTRPFIPAELMASHERLRVGQQPIGNMGVARQVLYAPPFRGFGQTPTTPPPTTTPPLPPTPPPTSDTSVPKPLGWGTFVFAGLLVGVSAALLMGATHKPKHAR